MTLTASFGEAHQQREVIRRESCTHGTAADGRAPSWMGKDHCASLWKLQIDIEELLKINLANLYVQSEIISCKQLALVLAKYVVYK